MDEKNFNAIARTQEKLDLAVADEYAALLAGIGDNLKLSLMAKSLTLEELKQVLVLYGKLSSELIKDLDRLNAETMALLLKDLAANNKLLDFVETQPAILKLWTKHKMEDWNALSAIEKANIDEAYQLSKANESIAAKVEEWVKRSVGYQRLANNNVQGLAFQRNVSSYYQSLKAALGQLVYEAVFEQIYLKFTYQGTNPKYAAFVGKAVESIADNILVERVGTRLRFIYGESKLGGASATDNQQMLMEMIKTGSFKAEVRSSKNLTSNSLLQKEQKISFDQINIFRGQTITDITQPIINWKK